MTPPKPNRGEIDLAEAIAWGEQHSNEDGASHRKGNMPDYAQIGQEFDGGAIGSILLSHASYLRKGFAPDLELHGTKGSLALDRIRGELRFADSPEPAKLLETITDAGDTNRFQRYAFPAFEQHIQGQVCVHPDLYDGWRVQIFTDAALLSARRGAWVEIDELDASKD